MLFIPSRRHIAYCFEIIFLHLPVLIRAACCVWFFPLDYSPSVNFVIFVVILIWDTQTGTPEWKLETRVARGSSGVLPRQKCETNAVSSDALTKTVFSLYQHVFLLYAINYCHEVVYLYALKFDFLRSLAASRLFYILHHLGFPGFRFFKEILLLNYLYTAMLTSFFPQLKVISLPEDSRYRPLKPVSFTWSFWFKLS